MNLKDKVVLVTGSSRGIGKVIALAFVDKGCKVIVCYNKGKKQAEKIKKGCKDSYLLHLDVTDEKSIRNSLVELKKNFFVPDIVVNNSGVLFAGFFERMSFEKIQEMVDVNFSGLMKVTATFMPELKKKKEGLIINIASIAPRYSSRHYIAYSATKAGVVNITKGLANELPKRIRSYCVSPGLTSTRMTKFIGVSTKKVSNVVIKVAEESIGLKSGEDVDVREHY